MERKGFDERFPARKSPAVKAVATRVRALRNEFGLSQAELTAQVTKPTPAWLIPPANSAPDDHVD
jgi:hypothetical protein